MRKFVLIALLNSEFMRPCGLGASCAVVSAVRCCRSGACFGCWRWLLIIFIKRAVLIRSPYFFISFCINTVRV